MRKRTHWLLPLLALCCGARPTWAQAHPGGNAAADSSFLALSERVTELQRFVLAEIPLASSGPAAFVPTARGGERGMVGVGVQVVNRQRNGGAPDGALGVVIPLGAPSRVGFDVSIAILDLRRSNGVGGFGRRGAVGAKLHRRFPRGTALAVGAETIFGWGETDTPASFYAVVTQSLRVHSTGAAMFRRAHLTAGVGYGRFGWDKDDQFPSSGGIGGIGNVSVEVLPGLDLFAEWTGQDLGAGISVVPFAKIPLVITPAVSDVTGRMGGGSRLFLAVTSGFYLH